MPGCLDILPTRCPIQATWNRFYGQRISKAIEAFQRANGIEQNGRIDKATVAALNAPSAAKQRQAEEEQKAQEAALALEKQRQAERAASGPRRAEGTGSSACA